MNGTDALITIALVVAGVIAAGAIMKFASDLPLVNQARDGFSKGL